MSAGPIQIVLFGGQGVGKGTQAKRLAESYGVDLIGAGDLLRQMAQQDTPSGRKIAPIIAAGKLVPGEIVTDLIALQLESIPTDQGFVLEGYPRTVDQSGQFKKVLERLRRTGTPTVFVKLEVPREIQRQRLLDRGRHDDTAAVIERRLRIYDQQTTPILTEVEPWAPVIHIDGNHPIPEVTELITNRLSDVQAKA